MSNFEPIAQVTDEVDLERSHITDLSIINIDSVPILLSTTQFDGVLQSWDISGNVAATLGAHAYAGTDHPGGTASLMTIGTDAHPVLLAAGAKGNTLEIIGIDDTGTFSTATSLGILPSFFGGFQYGASIPLSDGSTTIFGAFSGQSGIGQITFDNDHNLLSYQTIFSDTGTQTQSLSDLQTVTVNDATFLITTNSISNTVTSWAADKTGKITQLQTIGTEDGLWVSTPNVMATAAVGDSTYLVLGAAGSGTISVMEIGIDGSLIIRDHVLDTRDTRFAGITSLEVVQHDGQTFVIAGGADDGLTAFNLLEGGYLLPSATIADTVDIGLDNISAISAISTGDGLDVFVGSSSEVGLTQMRLTIAAAGLTLTATTQGGLLTGTDGADIIQGHDGDDILDGGASDDIIRDGNGNDVLSGGAGADVFILSSDDSRDIITDFEIGVDRIDLSQWSLLRDISQLTFRIQDYGVDITYGYETLIIESADSTFIDYRQFQTADLIGATRILPDIEPGYPGPETPINTPIVTVSIDQGDENYLGDGIAVINLNSWNQLRGAFDNQTDISETDNTLTESNGTIIGDDWINIILGSDDNDTIYGAAAADILLGRDGDDIIYGGTDADTVSGGDGHDQLFGDDGHDVIYGGAGDDVLDGGLGDDILFGDTGADTFIFNGGDDEIIDFTQGVDHLQLDASLWTGLTSAADVLFIYGSINQTQAVIDLGDGNILYVDGITDYTSFANDIDLF